MLNSFKIFISKLRKFMVLNPKHGFSYMGTGGFVDIRVIIHDTLIVTEDDIELIRDRDLRERNHRREKHSVSFAAF